MNAPVNVGVVGAVILRKGFNDGGRLLCSGRIVEVHERVTVYFLLQNRKLPPDLVYIQYGFGCRHAEKLNRVVVEV